MRLRLVATVLLLAVGAGSAGASSTEPTVRMRGLSAQQEAVVDGALALYAEAGLDLPGIDFVGHDDRQPCRDFAGYHVVEEGRSTVHLCGEHRGRFAEVLYLHEIAHAWDRANLDDERRADFLELRGLTEWRSDDRERWDELGAEHAAEILVWGLRDRPMRVIQIPDAGCDELHAGYVALTGEPPLHGYRDLC